MNQTKTKDYREQLAFLKLAHKIDSGLTLYHDFILKPRNPNDKMRDTHWDFDKKKFIDDGPAKFAWCKDCGGWAWGLGSICEKKYLNAYKNELELLDDET